RENDEVGRKHQSVRAGFSRSAPAGGSAPSPVARPDRSRPSAPASLKASRKRARRDRTMAPMTMASQTVKRERVSSGTPSTSNSVPTNRFTSGGSTRSVPKKGSRNASSSRSRCCSPPGGRLCMHRQRCAAVEHFAHRGHDLVVGEWLGDETVGLEIQRRLAVVLLPARRQDQDRYRAEQLVGTQGLEDIEAAQLGQHDVEQHHSRTELVGGYQRGFAVTRDTDLPAAACQDEFQRLQDRRFILDNENIGHMSPPRLRRTPPSPPSLH